MPEILAKCYWCGSVYKTQENFKYLQCTTCPWTIIEKAPTTYAILEDYRGKILESPYVGRMYDVDYRRRGKDNPQYYAIEERRKDKRGRSRRDNKKNKTKPKTGGQPQFRRR